MESPPPLRRIYQLAVQEECQRMAAVGHARIGDGVAFVALEYGFSPISNSSPTFTTLGSALSPIGDSSHALSPVE